MKFATPKEVIPMETRRELDLYIWKAVKDGFKSYLAEHENEEVSHTEAEQALRHAILKLNSVPIKF